MMKRLFPLALSLAALAFSGTLQAQVISATKSDGTPAATKKNPGDTVTYTNTITNSGGANATGVTFTDPDMAGAVVQNGTLKVSPIAFDDIYSGVIASGVGINTNTATEFSVTANDYVGVFNNNPGVITITAFDATSLNGGTVTMVTSGADMGKFTYVSAAGYTGADSFTYTISNTGFTATGTVNLTVAGPGMFFVSTTGNDTTGNGTLAAPFATLTKAATLDTTGDRIFVFTGAYAAGMAMETGEHIIGQGIVGASFDTEVLGVSPGADSATRPTIGGTKPTITAASGNVITLAASGNVIRGVTINSTVPGFAVAGFGTNTLQLGSASAGLAAADTAVNSTGTSGGCLTLAAAATGTVTVTAQLTATVGNSMVISDRTGGATSVIGKVTDNNLGISLANNTGATFNFRCLVLNTGANTGFSATGGGTVNATNGVSDSIDNDGDGSQDEPDEANTIVTSTGTALNVANTNIGASGLTFRSINSTTASANSGIVLNTTGTSGGLTVTGTGAGGTGGTISNKTTSGIALTSTASINLASMNITSNGDAIDENGIRATNLFGTCALTGVNASSNHHANVYVKNNTGTSSLSLTVSGCTFNSSSTHDGFDFFADPSGVASPLGGNMTLSVLNSTFSSNFSDGLFGGVTNNTTTGPGFCFITATTSTFNNNGANGMAIVSAGSSDTKFNIFSNVSISGNPSHGINLFQNNASASAAKLRGVVNNNVITYSAAGSSGTCLLLNTQGAGSGTVEITNNILNYNNGGARALWIQSGDGVSPGVLHLKTTGNTINVNGANPLHGMLVESGLTAASTRTINWHPGVAGSSDDTAIIRDSAATTVNVPRIQVRKRPNSFFNIHSISPSPATTETDVQNFLSSVMGITPATDINIGAPTTYHINYLTAVVDTTAATGAPLMFAPGGVQPAAAVEVPDFAAAPAQSGSSSEAQPTQSDLSNFAPATLARPAPLAQADLNVMVAAAIERWKQAGITSEQLALLKSVQFSVTNLPDMRVGEADGRTIRIDADAGGNGWFVDASDKLFDTVSSPTRFYTSPTAAPAGRLDLLTALMHELGHTLGLEDSYLAQDRESLMYGFITHGERRLPAMNQAKGAIPHEQGGKHYLTVPVVIGILPPGKSVTISYDVIINDPAAGPSITSQATVSGGNFTSVLTDDLVSGGDPLLPGADDQTVTLVDLPDVNVAVSGSPVAEDSGSPMTYTFTRTGSTAAAMTVNYNISGSGADPVNDFTVASGTGTATYASGTGTGTIIIPIGFSAATLTVTPIAEVQVEADETVVINVAAGTGYDIGIISPSATGTITNDDTGVRIDSLPDSSLFEDQIINFSYTFRRLGLTTGTTTVNFSVGGTTVFGTDYTQSGATTFTATTGTVVFAPGETTKVVTLDPTNDNVVEGNETIILTVTSGIGYIPLAATSQTATIVDDDSTVSVSGPVPATSIEDSGTGMVYTFTRTAPASNALTVNVVISGTAGFSGDYTTTGFASNNGAGLATITFAGGSTSRQVTITPSADVTGESDETVILTIAANGTPAVTGGYAVATAPNDSASGTIIDDDTQVSVAISPSSVGESSGTPMVYTFTRTGSTAAALTANFAITGTASFAASDYSLSATLPNTVNGGTGTGTVTFAIGSSTSTISASPLPDAIVEADETVIVTVAAGAGYVPAAGPNNVATGTINDDDVATVSIAKITDGAEGPPLVNGKFRLTQTAVSSSNTVVNYSIGGTATPGAGNDYATLSGTATILAGNTTVDIDVIVLADVSAGEPTETVIVTLTSLSGATDPQVTLGSPTSATVNIFSGPVPVASALGDVVTDNPAPGADGATNIGDFDLLRRSAYLGENGDLVFSGYLLIGAGPPAVTLNDFQGLWAKDAANPLRLIARSGSTAPGTGGAVFDILPEVPAISDGGDATFYASLRVGSGSPAVNGTNDTGLWTTLSVAGANPQPVLAVREGSALAPPSNAVITKFATGAYATASAGAGVIVFSATQSSGKSGVYVMTMSGGLPSAAVTSALEGNAAPGAGGDIWDNLASALTDPARMDANGNFCWAARVKPSHREGIWYAPIATGIAAKVVIAGDAAPGTTTTFSRFLNLPVMGGVNNIAFHAYVAATGDNATNTKADGVWKGVAPAAISTYTLVIRCGDSGVAGLPGGALVGNMWSPWMSNGNHVALRAWVDIDGNGSSGSGPDVTGLFTDADNTMRLVVKQGDAAPGMPGGATFNFMDLPVIGGVEQMAFLGTVTGGGTTAANNQGIWRQAANGGALSLVARTGDTVTTTQGVKTISKLDFPGTSQPAFTADRRWEQRVMDGTGRMVIQATFTDGTTGQLFTP